MKTAVVRSACLVAMVIAASQQTFSQLVDFSSSPGYSAMTKTMIDNYILNSSTRNHTKEGNGTSTTSRTSTTAPASPPQVPEYRRYPAVQFKSTGTRLTMQEYLDSINASPQDKAEIKELVLGILKSYDVEAAAKGYPNDWALAFVSYVGLNSLVYHGRTEKPVLPFEQNIGLRDVVAEYATDHGILNNLTDRKKQEQYELLVMIGALTFHFYEKALKEKNAEEIKNCQLIAAQNLKLVGIKP